jgi:hypothetical protein
LVWGCMDTSKAFMYVQFSILSIKNLDPLVSLSSEA